MRNNTEWVETLELGANRLVGASSDRIVEAIGVAVHGEWPRDWTSPFQPGASRKSATILESLHQQDLLRLESSDYLLTGIPTIHDVYGSD